MHFVSSKLTMAVKNGGSQSFMEQSSVGRNSGELKIQTSLVGRYPSYASTSWATVNRALDIVDKVTNGRADWVQRFFSYSFIGGIAATVNLTIFTIVYHRLAMPASHVVHNLIAQGLAQVMAFEISLMVNFVPNDYFTFRHLAGHKRSWGARFLRYHITSISGLCLTTLIQFFLTNGVHVPYFFSQAIALMLVFIYNFTFHHLFTYRHKSHTVQQSAIPVHILQPEVAKEPVVAEDMV